MKKSTIWLVVLVLLPLLAAGVEGFPNSVQVWNPETGEAQFCSFFALVPDSQLAFLMPLTAILTCIATVQAIVYAINKRQSIFKSMLVICAVALVASTIPNIAPTNPKILPNVFVSIFLLAETLVVYKLKKKPVFENQDDSGKRLGLH